jgi:hypothetical protein
MQGESWVQDFDSKSNEHNATSRELGFLGPRYHRCGADAREVFCGQKLLVITAVKSFS